MRCAPTPSLFQPRDLAGRTITLRRSRWSVQPPIWRPLARGEGQLQRLNLVGPGGQLWETIWKCPHRVSDHLVHQWMESRDVLQAVAGHPGFRSAHRTVITAFTEPSLVAEEPASEGAVVMPYIAGQSLAEALEDGEALTPQQAVGLMQALLLALGALTDANMSHGDLKADNLLMNEQRSGIEVIDLEGIQHPDRRYPSDPVHSPGYQHVDPRSIGNDRFPLALCLAVLAVLSHAPARAAIGGRHTLFTQPFPQRCHDRSLHATIEAALASLHSDLVALYRAALASRTIQTCPSPDHWQRVVSLIAQPPRPAVTWKPWPRAAVVAPTPSAVWRPWTWGAP